VQPTPSASATKDWMPKVSVPAINVKQEGKAEMVTPVVGSPEWKKQEATDELLDGRLNKQIHGICRGC
jgi:hypothetical protein